ncbi:hypothetical protein HZS_5229, partial [Henneguya salminicola]
MTILNCDNKITHAQKVMAVTRRLTKDLEELKVGDLKERVSIHVGDENILNWQLTLIPFSEPYNNYSFIVNVYFPSEYPFKPPKMVFKTKIYHPNIDEQGQFCLDVINNQNWKPATRTERIIRDLLDLIDNPELSSPIRTELAEEYIHKKKKFLKKAAEY